MNCANHPETPVTAYCQNCGKGICQQCVRSVGGVIYCEPCLAAKVAGGTPATPGQPSSGPVYMGPPAMTGPRPGLALALGFIPGVGAMYNGQFVKGFVHVFIFAILSSFSSHESFFGILIPFWIAYQVFDAYQTARARRDGTPLPNPFGLNDLGYRLGLQQHPEGTVAPPPGAPFVDQPSAPPYTPPATPFTPHAHPPGQPGMDPHAAGFVPDYSTPAPPYAAPFAPAMPPRGAKDIPVGAVILIGLGVLFLLGSLGIFRDDWLSRGWPLIIVGVGVWLVIRRTREVRPPNDPTIHGGGSL